MAKTGIEDSKEKKSAFMRTTEAVDGKSSQAFISQLLK